MSSLPLSALPALQPPHLAYDPGGRDRPARPRDPVPRAPRPLRSAREDHAVDAPPLALGVGDRRDRVLDALPPLRARVRGRVYLVLYHMYTRLLRRARRGGRASSTRSRRSPTPRARGGASTA